MLVPALEEVARVQVHVVVDRALLIQVGADSKEPPMVELEVVGQLLL